MNTSGLWRAKGQRGSCRTCHRALGDCASWCSGGVMLGSHAVFQHREREDYTCRDCGYSVCTCVAAAKFTPEPPAAPEPRTVNRVGWQRCEGDEMKLFIRDDSRAFVGLYDGVYFARHQEGGADINSPGSGWSQTRGEQPDHASAEAAMHWADAKLAAEDAAKAPKQEAAERFDQWCAREVETLPPGWRKTDRTGELVHTSGASVEPYQPGKWKWFKPNTVVCLVENHKPSRAEAMAAALGYEVHGHGWSRGEGVNAWHGVGFPSAEIAARDACEHYAKHYGSTP